MSANHTAMTVLRRLVANARRTTEGNSAIHDNVPCPKENVAIMQQTAAVASRIPHLPLSPGSNAAAATTTQASIKKSIAEKPHNQFQAAGMAKMRKLVVTIATPNSHPRLRASWVAIRQHTRRVTAASKRLRYRSQARFQFEAKPGR